MKRSPRELAGWVMRDNPIPPGSVLLTGTGLVRPTTTRSSPATVEIEIEGIGMLANTVPVDRYGASMTETIDAPTRPTGRNYVGGEWVPASSGETYTKVDPDAARETVGEFSSSSEADAAAAVAAAAAAFAAWAALPMARRAAYLTRPRPCSRRASRRSRAT